jgi:hypothetical protein
MPGVRLRWRGAGGGPPGATATPEGGVPTTGVPIGVMPIDGGGGTGMCEAAKCGGIGATWGTPGGGGMGTGAPAPGASAGVLLCG